MEIIEVMKDLVKAKIISHAEPKKKEKMRSEILAPRTRERAPPQSLPVQPPQIIDLVEIPRRDTSSRHRCSIVLHSTITIAIKTATVTQTYDL